VALSVVDGDRVRRGSRSGRSSPRRARRRSRGREMLRQAATQADRSDAERAVALAEKNLVPRPLLATVDGSVLAHVANAGTESPRTRRSSRSARPPVVPGGRLRRSFPDPRGAGSDVDLAGGRSAAGTVHSVMPPPTLWTSPLPSGWTWGRPGNVEIGLFGNARGFAWASARSDPSPAPHPGRRLRVSRVCLAVDGNGRRPCGVSQDGKPRSSSSDRSRPGGDRLGVVGLLESPFRSRPDERPAPPDRGPGPSSSLACLRGGA
jgi:hypothetical protein